MRIFDIAAGTPGRVVFVHCGVLSIGVRKRLGLSSPFDMRFGNPLDLQMAGLRYPALPIVVPHFGAGFFREALMTADLCQNLHFDTSSSNGWIKFHPGLTLDIVFKQALEVVGPERLIFGTDSSFFPRGWQKSVYDAQRAVLERLNVDEESQRKIFGGNFDRIFSRAE
jgi:predicted TIM-barrel fold metal-dependent hydrolase